MKTFRNIQAAAAAFLVLAISAHAQVKTDGSMGAIKTLQGPNYSIPNTLGQIAGKNLFHSFSQFNINPGESATFCGPASIRNIISRVTGGQLSNIDGLLRSTINGANFYLINPSGIMFGPNAKLDISGSFYATTADYLKLGATGRFDAATPANSILTVDDPSAFGFLGTNSGSIKIDSSRLSVPAGEALSFVGGDITITNNSDLTVLNAPGGRIDLASVASSGELMLTPTGIDASAFSKMGIINVSNTWYHNLNASNGDISATSATTGGSIYISGGKFVLDKGWIFSKTNGQVDGKGIVIDARSSMEMKNYSWMVSDAFSSGNAGNITITTPNLTVSDFGGISASTAGTGNGGTIKIENTNNANTVNILNYGSILSETYGPGNAGSITIDAKDVAIKGGGYLSTMAALPISGQGGDIDIRANGSLTVSGSYIASDSAGSMKAGDITITSPNLTVSDFGFISASTTGSGNGGAIKIENTDNANTVNILNYGSILSETYGPGNAGSITIDAKDVAIKGGGNLSTMAALPISGQGGDIDIRANGSLTISGPTILNTATISSETFSAKKAGNITITTPNLTVSDSGIISASTTGSGNGGAIKIENMNNANTVNILNSGSIRSETSGPGNAGNITIAANKLTLQGGGSVVTTAVKGNSGQGGDITVTSSDLITVSGLNSCVISSTASTKDAGSITITTPNLTVTDSGMISSSTVGKGNAGSVRVLYADVVNISTMGSIKSTSDGNATGNAGSITIDTKTLTLKDAGAVSTTSVGNESGKAGDIIVNATDSVTVTGSLEKYLSSIQSDTWSNNETANGGNITITTPNLTVSSNGNIRTNTYGNGNAGAIQLKISDTISIDYASVSSATGKRPDDLRHEDILGNAGTITIETNTLRIMNEGQIGTGVHKGSQGQGGHIFVNANESVVISGHETSTGYISGIFTDSSSSGNAGSISLNTKSLSITDGGRISAKSSSTGKAGDLLINVTDKIFMDSGSITTATTNADGGNITIDPAMMDLRNSSITTSVNGGSGNGGNISIAAGTFLLDHSKIIAQAVGGNGGNISINADVFLYDPASLVSASSQLGLPGRVGINAPLVDLSGNLVTLPEGMLGRNELTPRQCITTGESSSSFVVNPVKLQSQPDRNLIVY